VKNPDSKKTGFTLVEVMVAVTIGGFIMLVAVGTLRAITSSAEMVETNISAAAEVRFAMNLIKRDLVNFYRDENIQNTKLIGTAEESASGNVSYLVFYTINRMKARADQPEGDIYEVEYSLLQDEEKSLLMRRLWPNPNDEYADEPHGILAVIAEDIEIFEVRYFDGEEWSNEWPEEMEVLPQLIEVSIVGKPQSRGTPSMESIMINLTRSVTASVAESETSEQGGQGGGGQGGGPGGGGQGGNQGGGGQGGNQGGGGGGNTLSAPGGGGRG
jgi:general secretion pathway protein J